MAYGIFQRHCVYLYPPQQVAFLINKHPALVRQVIFFKTFTQLSSRFALREINGIYRKLHHSFVVSIGLSRLSLAITFSVAGRPCPLPKIPENVKPVVGRFLMGDSIMLQCHQGYGSTEQLSITCQQDLTWSKPLGVCQSKTLELTYFRTILFIGVPWPDRLSSSSHKESLR